MPRRRSPNVSWSWGRSGRGAGGAGRPRPTRSELLPCPAPRPPHNECYISSPAPCEHHTAHHPPPPAPAPSHQWARRAPGGQWQAEGRAPGTAQARHMTSSSSTLPSLPALPSPPLSYPTLPYPTLPSYLSTQPNYTLPTSRH